MANLEQLPEPQRRHASRLSRVSYRWLRQKGPLAADLEECVQARKVIAEASLEASADELISTRDQQDPERYQMDRRYLKRLSKSWEELLKKTHRNCAESVVKELGPVHLEPLYPDLKVQEAFLQARKAHESVTTYTYHGTKKENIESISQIGFLMPGQGGHTVKNGSVHGVGIYTARLGCAKLSKGFCDSDKMFLCCVCDSSKEVTESIPEPASTWKPSSTVVQTTFPKRTAPLTRTGVKKYEIHRKSDEVIHVGDAVVSFKQDFVVPMFLISPASEAEEEKKCKTGQAAEALERPEVQTNLVLKHHAWVPEEEEPNWALPQQVATRQLAVPAEQHGKLVKFGSKDRQGRTVWVVEDPFACANSEERSLKRHYLKRQRDRQLRLARREKQEDSCLW